MLFLSLNNNLNISSVVKESIGANHFSNAFKIILRSKIVDFSIFQEILETFQDEYFFDC